jgi:hypothetical protein
VEDNQGNDAEEQNLLLAPVVDHQQQADQDNIAEELNLLPPVFDQQAPPHQGNLFSFALFAVSYENRCSNRFSTGVRLSLLIKTY